MKDDSRRVMVATWADMDFNRHFGNAAYLNICTTVRMMHFADQGVAMTDFETLKIGPVVFRDEVEYYREIHLLEMIEVSLELVGASDDYSHFSLRNELWKGDGTKAARIVSTGGWFNVTTRKLVLPPAPIRSALEALRRGQPFHALPTLIKRAKR